MASPVSGATASLAVAASTLAFAAASVPIGTTVLIAVSIPGTATVTGISDGSANAYTSQGSAANGSTVRTELWQGIVTAATASRTITITFSGATLASASYEIYSGVPNVLSGLISPQGMTGYSTPAPYTIASSTEVNTGWHNWYAFQGGSGGTGLGWGSSGGSNAWISVDLGSGIFAATQYQIVTVTGQGTNVAPKNWTFQGSNDNSAWTTLDTQPNETGWAEGSSRTYTFTNTTIYRYYRLFVVVNNGGPYVMIGQLNITASRASIPTPNTGSASGTGFYPNLYLTPQDQGSIFVTSFAVATNSGDVLNQMEGTRRQVIVPALTTASSALCETASALETATYPSSLLLNASRVWAAVSLELRAPSSVALATITPSKPQAQPVGMSFPAPTPSKQGPPLVASPLFAGSSLVAGVPGVAYTATISAIGGVSPFAFNLTSGSLPAGLILNSSTGVISGTPTTAGTSVFTIVVVDRNGWYQSQAFTLVVAVPVTGGSGGSYTYAG